MPSRMTIAAGLVLGSTALAVPVGWRLRAAVGAYVYAYSLVTMEITRRVMTNVAVAGPLRAPMGQFVKARAYPDATFRDATAPNTDTLYTSAWLDVGDEPWILSLPDLQGRYALFPMMDAWTNVFASPGTRTTGTAAQTYVITGPGSSSALPPGVRELKSPTSLVWILGRVYSTGTSDDYAAVHALQDRCALAPLRRYGQSYVPPPSHVDPSLGMSCGARKLVNGLDTVAYFTLFADLLRRNPAAAADGPHCTRRRATSGRSRSLATTVFFEAELLSVDKVPHRPVVDLQAAVGQFAHQTS